MLSKQACEKIVNLAVAHARRKADGIEVHIDGSNIATSRFACNGMTQNQCPENVSISVRAIKNGRQALQTTEDLSPAGVKAVVDNAIAAALMLEPDEELLPLADRKLAREMAKRAGTKGAPGVSRFDMRTARFSAEDRAEQVRAMIDVAKQHGFESSGTYASGTCFSAIGNSKGIFVYHRETVAECSVTMEGPTSSGWAKQNSTRVTDVSARELAEKAAKTAIEGANPRELAPGHYTAILPPTAVLDLLGFLWEDFSAVQHIDGVSSLTGKLGKQLFGKNITITDDSSHPLQSGETFDGEGMTRSSLVLVENGVVKNVVKSRQSALKMGGEPTGHAQPQPTDLHESAENIVVQGGDTSLEEMIRMTDKGVLLSRVWYVRTVDPETVLLTGMTRDGTFFVENGKVAFPVKNFRFNVSIHDLLNNVIALGPAVRAAGEEAEPAVVPAMLVKDFNFTEVTKF